MSFDTLAIISKARSLMRRYEANGIGRDRVLIKIASTWEGIIAAAGGVSTAATVPAAAFGQLTAPTAAFGQPAAAASFGSVPTAFGAARAATEQREVGPSAAARAQAEAVRSHCASPALR